MKKSTFLTYGSSLVIATSLAFTSGQIAAAGQNINGWNKSIDSNNDSLSRTPGTDIFEMYVMGTKEDEQFFYVAINGNLPVTGLDTGNQVCNTSTGQCFNVSNQNIGYGDLFLDFSGQNNFLNASNSRSLIGVRFAPNNDSKVSGTGIFDYVKATDVERENAGYWNFGTHNQIVTQQGGTASLGDLAWDDPYYAPYNGSFTSNPIPNVIESGNKIGDITMLNSAELAAAGFDLSSLSQIGSETFGFKFSKSLLPIGKYLATLILECNNDAIALRGETTKITVQPPQEVPEPSTIFGIMTTALIFAATKFGKLRKFELSK
ncbi:MAG: hypothetical protein RLZZ507_2126 [Cyanobacteriota bacterium]|jgi:hypothetical protein